ncbi:MAG: type II secretion system protein [Verrucomicrobiota bacterium]
MIRLKHSSNHSLRHSGFTLLEMMLSIGVFLLLIASAFSLVGATTELMTEVSDLQADTAIRHRFIESCRTAFEASTAESSYDFLYFDRGSDRQDSYLTLTQVPGAFDFGANLEDQITQVVIATEVQPDGLLKAGVYYMTDADYEEAQTTQFQESQARYIELMPRLRVLRWRFYDAERREWMPTLDGNLKTSLIELTIQSDFDAKPLRSVFYCLTSP